MLLYKPNPWWSNLFKTALLTIFVLYVLSTGITVQGLFLSGSYIEHASIDISDVKNAIKTESHLINKHLEHITYHFIRYSLFCNDNTKIVIRMSVCEGLFFVSCPRLFYCIIWRYKCFEKSALLIMQNHNKCVHLKCLKWDNCMYVIFVRRIGVGLINWYATCKYN